MHRRNSGKSLKNTWESRKIYKFGDGAKKGLDLKQIQLIEKMNGFQANVPDLFSDTMSSVDKNIFKTVNDDKSIQQLSSNTNQPNHKRKFFLWAINILIERTRKLRFVGWWVILKKQSMI